MMIKTLVAIAIVASLAGCGGVNFASHMPRYIPKYDRTVKIPVEGGAATAQVGDSMIAAFNVDTVPALKLSAPVELRTKYNDKWQLVAVVPAGTLNYAGETSAYTFFASTEGVPLKLVNANALEDHETQRGGLAIGSTGQMAVYWYWEKDDQSAVSSPVPEAKFEKVKVDLPAQAQRFRRELIYGGVSGTTVSVSYREFVDNMARPAFTQDLKYDLSQGSIIGYKSARFEVLKADNSSIRFRVIKQLD